MLKVLIVLAIIIATPFVLAIRSEKIRTAITLLASIGGFYAVGAFLFL